MVKLDGYAHVSYRCEGGAVGYAIRLIVKLRRGCMLIGRLLAMWRSFVMRDEYSIRSLAYIVITQKDPNRLAHLSLGATWQHDENNSICSQASMPC